MTNKLDWKQGFCFGAFIISFAIVGYNILEGVSFNAYILAGVMGLVSLICGLILRYKQKPMEEN